MAAEESEDEDFIFYGTPIEDELQVQHLAHKPTLLDPGKTKSAPLHLQVPTDEQGRKRFHGAFTGGFSAGYFNTVGSKEGFEPAAFRSSRSDRASVKQQSVEAFMDEDEKQEHDKTTLQAEYDTFGAAALEVARAKSQRDASARPSLIPGPAIAELLVPTAESLGVQLLQKMGWRAGRGIVTAPTAPGGAAGGGKRDRWGTVAGVSLENTPLYVLEPKQDVHGLGFDPFAGAEDFRALKKQREQAKQAELQRAAAVATSKLNMGGGAGQQVGKRPRGVAFGGVTDDSGMYGYMEDYVDDDEAQPPTKQAALMGKDLREFDYELGSSGSDEEERPGKHRRPLLLERGSSPPLMLQDAAQLRKGGDFIPGFVKSDEQVVLAVYPAPDVPDDWQPIHKFPKPQQHIAQQQEKLPPPPEMPPPDDPELRKQIDSLAAMVARSGPAVEQLARKQAAQQQHQQQETNGASAGDTAGASKFSFLLGGEGALYYTWRLYKIKSALAAVARGPAAAAAAAAAAGSGAQQQAKRPGKAGPLTVEQRMQLLGEEALPATAAAQQALSKAVGLAAGELKEQAAPQPQVAEGDKQRLQAALGSMFVKGSSQDMVLESGQPLGLRKGGKQPSPSPPSQTNPPGPAAASSAAAAAMLASFGSRFTSASSSETLAARAAGLLQPTASGLTGTSALTTKEEVKPRRWFEDWRPEPLVCKRFNVPDPYKGKALAPQMPKFKTDYLALPETSLGLAGAPAVQGLPGLAVQAVQAPAVQALPPPPPLPIDMAAAVARAAAIAQQLTAGQPSSSAAAAAGASQPSTAPMDAKSYAASFLDSLAASDGMFESSGLDKVPAAAGVAEAKGAADEALQDTTAAGPAATQDAADADQGVVVDASADFLSLDRPLDIFKAIFEADDEEDEEEQEQATQGADLNSNATAGAQQQQPAAGTAQQPSNAPVAVDVGGVGSTPQQQGLASALLQAQQRAKQQAQAQSSQQQPSSQQAGPGPPSQPGLAGAASLQGGPSNGVGSSALAVDPEVQQRILAALAVMKKDKKKGKKDKDKKKKPKHKKHKKSGEKERSSKHSSKHKSGSRSKHKSDKTSSKKHRRSSGRDSDDSSADISDSSADSSSDNSSGAE